MPPFIGVRHVLRASGLLRHQERMSSELGVETINDLLELKHDVTTKATGAKDDAPAKQGSDDPSLAKLTGLRPLEVYDISILLHPRLQKTRMPGQRYATYVNRRYSKCIAYVEFHSISMAQMACQQYNGRHFIYE